MTARFHGRTFSVAYIDFPSYIMQLKAGFSRTFYTFPTLVYPVSLLLCAMKIYWAVFSFGAFEQLHILQNTLHIPTADSS